MPLVPGNSFAVDIELAEDTDIAGLAAHNSSSAAAAAVDSADLNSPEPAEEDNSHLDTGRYLNSNS